MLSSLRSPIDRLLVVLSLITAAAWFALVVSHRDGGALVVVKALPIPLLAAIAARHRAHLLASALLLHGIGDALIEFSFRGGMVAFLAGHVLYLVLFLRHRSAPAPASAWLRVALLGALGIFVLATLARGL